MSVSSKIYARVCVYMHVPICSYIQLYVGICTYNGRRHVHTRQCVYAFLTTSIMNRRKKQRECTSQKWLCHSENLDVLPQIERMDLWGPVCLMQTALRCVPNGTYWICLVCPGSQIWLFHNPQSITSCNIVDWVQPHPKHTCGAKWRRCGAFHT